MLRKSPSFMARKPRVKSRSGIYHVVLQGAAGKSIFREEEDYLQFLHTLLRKQPVDPADTDSPAGYTIYAYCLLPTHVHLLMAEAADTIGSGLKRINSSYAHYFNRKYATDGPLYKGRFMSEPVEDDARFLEVLTFIHQNPVSHRLAPSVADYIYSSLHEYQGTQSPLPGLCTCRDFCDTVLSDAPASSDCLEVRPQPTPKPSDGQVWLSIARLCGARDKAEFLNLPAPNRLTILTTLRRQGASVRQLESLTGIGRGIIQRL